MIGEIQFWSSWEHLSRIYHSWFFDHQKSSVFALARCSRGRRLGMTEGVPIPIPRSYGYGSIPIHTIFRGWTSINPSYFDVNYRGIGFWPIPILVCIPKTKSWWNALEWIGSLHDLIPKDGTKKSFWIGSTQLFENKNDATNPINSIVNDTFVILSAPSFAADKPQNSLTTSYFLVVKSPMLRHFGVTIPQFSHSTMDQ